MVQFVFKLEQTQNPSAPFWMGSAVPFFLVDSLSQFQVALGCKGREQVKALKDKADLAPPDFGSLGVAHGCQVGAVHRNPAASRRQQAPNYVKQCRLSAP